MKDERQRIDPEYGSFGAKRFGKKLASPITNTVEKIANGGLTNEEMNALHVQTDKTLVRGSIEWNARMDEFELRMREMNSHFFGLIQDRDPLAIAMRDQEKWRNGQNRKQLIEDNRYYNYMLMHACAMPLAQGISAESLVECMGMYIGCMIGSPAFRAQAMQGMHDRHVRKLQNAAAKLEKAQDFGTKMMMGHHNRSAQFQSLIGNDAAAQRHRDRASELAFEYNSGAHNIGTKWKNAIRKWDNNGVEPMSPNVYSMHVISLQKAAYQQMREPGADLGNIEKDLQKAIDTLTDRAFAEGLIRGKDGKLDPEMLEALNKNTRHMTQELMLAHPELQAVFQESSYGEVHTYNPDGSPSDDVIILCHERNGENIRDFTTLTNEQLQNEFHQVNAGANFNREHNNGVFYIGHVKEVPVTDERGKPVYEMQPVYAKDAKGKTIIGRDGKPQQVYNEDGTPAMALQPIMEKQVTVERMTGNFHVRRPVHDTVDYIDGEPVISPAMDNVTGRLKDIIDETMHQCDNIDDYVAMAQSALDPVACGSAYVDMDSNTMTSGEGSFVEYAQSSMGKHKVDVTYQGEDGEYHTKVMDPKGADCYVSAAVYNLDEGDKVQQWKAREKQLLSHGGVKGMSEAESKEYYGYDFENPETHEMEHVIGIREKIKLAERFQNEARLETQIVSDDFASFTDMNTFKHSGKSVRTKCESPDDALALFRDQIDSAQNKCGMEIQVDGMQNHTAKSRHFFTSAHQGLRGMAASFASHFASKFNRSRGAERTADGPAPTSGAPRRKQPDAVVAMDLEVLTGDVVPTSPDSGDTPGGPSM